MFNFNTICGVSLVGSVSTHEVNIVELFRDVLQIYKDIERDLREKAIQNFYGIRPKSYKLRVWLDTRG